MSPDEMNELIEKTQILTEALGGLRKQLIAQGFSVEAAEELVVLAVKNQSGGN